MHMACSKLRVTAKSAEKPSGCWPLSTRKAEARAAGSAGPVPRVLSARAGLCGAGVGEAETGASRIPLPMASFFSFCLSVN